MTKWDLEQAFGSVDLRYVKSVRVFLNDLPSWRCVMKRSVKFAVAAAVAVLAVGVMAVAMLLQSGPETGNFPAAVSSGTPEKKTLHIVTDLGFNWVRSRSQGSADMESIAEVHLQTALGYFHCMPEGFEIELEVLPTESGDLKSRLTRIRTEIMAGGGPDGFILSCESTRGNRDWLFPNPEKAMLDGFFLPLDEYMENARVMEWEKLTPAVMAGGKTEQGQMVLPLFYTYSVAKVNAPFSTDDLPQTWEEALASEDELVRKGYGLAASRSFRNVFGETVDLEKNQLAFSEQELADRVTEALSLYNASDTIPVEGFEVAPQDPSVFGPDSMIGKVPDWGVEDGETAAFFPIHNMDGGVSANITTYAAVNSNTEYGKEVFSVLEVLLSKEFQSGELFWKGKVNGKTRNFGSSICVFSAAEGVPVHEELLREDSPISYDNYISDELFPAYCSVRDQITEAHLTTNVDETLDELYWNCWKIETGDAKRETKDKTIRKMVSKAYDTMQMMLAES